MAFSSSTGEERMLLDLMVQHIRNQMEGEIVAALKPVIDKAIDAAVAELSPVIAKHYDIARNGMIHQLIVTRRDK